MKFVKPERQKYKEIKVHSKSRLITLIPFLF